MKGNNVEWVNEPVIGGGEIIALASKDHIGLVLLKVVKNKINELVEEYEQYTGNNTHIIDKSRAFKRLLKSIKLIRDFLNWKIKIYDDEEEKTAILIDEFDMQVVKTKPYYIEIIPKYEED